MEKINILRLILVAIWHIMMYKKSPFIIALVGFIISCSSIQEDPHKKESYSADSPPKVSTAILKKANFQLQTISNGVLQPSVSAKLFFETKGVIEEIYYNNGQYIKKGNVIASLKNARQRLALRKAEELLKGAETELYSLILGFGGKNGDTSSVGNRLLQSLKSQSGYSMAELNLKAVGMDYKGTFLIAPFSGIIAGIEKQEHNQTSGTKPFCSLFSRNSFIAQFTVTEEELPKLKTDQNVIIFPVAFDTISVYGHITEIDPQVDKNGLIKIKASIVMPEVNSYPVLLAGMNIKVIVEETIPNQLFIPKSALVLRSGKKVVFTYSGGLAKWNYVEISNENSTSFMITEGLNENDTIIVRGGLNLAHDAVVKLENN